jgi:FkbM family methyltransferase
VILPYVKEGTCAFDVGAHVGSHSLAYTNAGAIVFAFEPNPEAFEALKKNVPGARAYNLAICDWCGMTEFGIVAQHRGMSYLKREQTLEAQNEQVTTIRVRTTTLDQILGSNERLLRSKGLSFLKIDTEGSEPLVLKGGYRLISELKPVVLCEVNYNRLYPQGFSDWDIFSHLNILGYRWIDVPREKSLRYEEHYAYDILAMPIR